MSNVILYIYLNKEFDYRLAVNRSIQGQGDRSKVSKMLELPESLNAYLARYPYSV